MTFKHNILIYYHRNTKKYNTLLILRFILDIQQRFIGAIFVLIVLIKESPLPVIIYWCYIVFFYLTKKDARQLKITNIFIAIVTLLQYSIIMMQQTVTDEQKDYKLISYIFKVLASKEPGAFEDNFKVLFTILGLNSPTQQTTLLYDSIPTVLFQITIFYYDFFLLFCAERLETVLLRIRTGIYYVLEDALGKKYYLINFQEWKDSAGKILALHHLALHSSTYRNITCDSANIEHFPSQTCLELCSAHHFIHDLFQRCLQRTDRATHCKKTTQVCALALHLLPLAKSCYHFIHYCTCKQFLQKQIPRNFDDRKVGEVSASDRVLYDGVYQFNIFLRGIPKGYRKNNKEKENSFEFDSPVYHV
jgi:hypothetical protein